LQLTKDHNQAEDLFQDTALKAFRYQDKFTPNTNLKAWLGTIMKNAFINLYRKRRWRNVSHHERIIRYNQRSGR